MAPARRRHRPSAVADRRPDPESREFGFLEQGIFAREQGIFAPLVRPSSGPDKKAAQSAGERDRTGKRLSRQRPGPVEVGSILHETADDPFDRPFGFSPQQGCGSRVGD